MFYEYTKISINIIKYGIIKGFYYINRFASYAYNNTYIPRPYDISIPYDFDFSTLFVFLVILSISTFAYIKLKYPFWNIQPVFHTYDYWRYLYQTPFIIRNDIPMVTKYCNFSNIKTYDYLEVSQETRNEFIDFLRCHYIPTDRILYTMTDQIMNAYMTGNTEAAYISRGTVGFCFAYPNDHLPLTATNFQIQSINSYQEKREGVVGGTVGSPTGVITSRPFQIYYNILGSTNSYTKLTAYYIDNICTSRHSKNAHTSRNLLQTHEFNQRLRSSHIKVSLLKKEIHLCRGIVPLVKYNTYTFRLNPQNHRGIPKFPPHTHIVHIVKTNLSILQDFLVNITSLSTAFTFCGISDPGVLANLIAINQLYVFCLKVGKDIHGFYFFKNANCQYEDYATNNQDCDSLHFIASFCNTQSPPLFFLGFLHSIKAILKLKKTFRILLFDDLSHNKMLIESWMKTNPVVADHECAYYLYNMVFPRTPLKQEKCLFLL